nr:Asp-tRNA(Asn)/Glu-tRNA(Gln) amidotransferase subunit GatA [Patescibacteria group bacterium]
MYEASRGKGFGDEVKRRMLLGTYVLSKGYVDAYYRKARKVRQMIATAYDRLLQDVDMLVTPTTPGVAFKIGEKLNDPMAMYLEDIFTVSINVAGVPAISVPCGREERTGLPIGIQLIGRRFDDGRLLSWAHAYERE